MLEERCLKWVEYTKVDAEVTRSKERVVREIGLSICVNKRHFTTVMMTPVMEVEFVVGHLFGQGVIEGASEIESIEIVGNTAELMVKDTHKIFQSTGKSKQRVVSRGGKSAVWDDLCLPRIKSDMRIAKEAIFKAMNMVFEKLSYIKQPQVYMQLVYLPQRQLQFVS